MIGSSGRRRKIISKSQTNFILLGSRGANFTGLDSMLSSITSIITKPTISYGLQRRV